LWCAKRRPNDFNSLASEHGVKPIGEFLIPIANQRREATHAPSSLKR